MPAEYNAVAAAWALTTQVPIATKDATFPVTEQTAGDPDEYVIVCPIEEVAVME